MKGTGGIYFPPGSTNTESLPTTLVLTFNRKNPINSVSEAVYLNLSPSAQSRLKHPYRFFSERSQSAFNGCVHFTLSVFLLLVPTGGNFAVCWLLNVAGLEEKSLSCVRRNSIFLTLNLAPKDTALSRLT